MADAYEQTFGAVIGNAVAGPAFGTFTLNQSTDKLVVVFAAKEDATITRLGLRIGTITGTVTWRISLQGVDASGNEDGTVLGGGSPASATFEPSGLGWASGDWRWVTLSNSINVTRGTSYAFVVEYSSGTLGSLVVTTNAGLAAGGFPYAIQNDNGSRSRPSGLPVFGYGSSTKAYGFPMETLTELSYAAASSPDEWAMKFTVPTNFCSTYKVKGVRIIGARPVAAGSSVVTLYDTDGTTVLQNETYDHDQFQDNTANRNAAIIFDETTLSTLTAGNTYRVSVVPSSTQSWRVWAIDVDAVADWDAWPGGQQIAASSRADAGAWTDLTTRRLNMELILDDITAPSGGGGGGIVIGG